MAFAANYAGAAPAREEIDARPGALLLEFGVAWCPHCQRAQASIEAALRRHPELAHVKIEDGPGRRLGRSFRVREWPTLIFLSDGRELERLVRPQGSEAIGEAIDRLLTTKGPA